MKKNYVSPCINIEIFETSDVITASLLNTFPTYTGDVNGTDNVAKVDLENAEWE